MNYTIEITLNTENDSFHFEHEIEIQRVLKNARKWASKRIANHNYSDVWYITDILEKSFNDYNGNAVCTVTIKKG